MLKRILDFIFKYVKSNIGRNGRGYHKIKLFESKFLKRDAYLIQYPIGSEARPHKDPSPIEGLGHFRTNVVLIPATKGGKFVIAGKARYERVQRFRADQYKHRVTEVKEGTRYVLSFGRLR